MNIYDVLYPLVLLLCFFVVSWVSSKVVREKTVEVIREIREIPVLLEKREETEEELPTGVTANDDEYEVIMEQIQLQEIISRRNRE